MTPLIESIQFKFIGEIPFGSRVVLYGAGGRGLELFHEIRLSRADIEVVYFADTSKRGEVEGLPVFSPQQLQSRKNEFDLICICSHWWKNIAVLLNELGLSSLAVIESKKNRGQLKEVLISHQHKFIYLNIYRAASSGIKGGLTNAVGQSLFFERIEINNPRYDSYFKFTFIRNPWDRVLSCYMGKFVNYQIKQGTEDYYGNLIKPIQDLMGVNEISFDTFVDYVAKENDIGADPHWRSLVSFVCDENDKILVDFVGRFENIEQDFSTVCNTIGINAKLTHGSASGKTGSYRDSYDQITKKLIGNRYRKGIELFSYTF